LAALVLAGETGAGSMAVAAAVIAFLLAGMGLIGTLMRTFFCGPLLANEIICVRTTSPLRLAGMWTAANACTACSQSG